MKKKVAVGVFVGLLVFSIGYGVWRGWCTRSRVEDVSFTVSKGCYRKSQVVQIWVRNERGTSITVYPSLAIQKLTVKGWKNAFAWYTYPESQPSVTVSPGEQVVVIKWKPTERGIFQTKMRYVTPPLEKDVSLMFSVI